MDTREWIDASTIGGNASRELKQSLVDLISAAAKLNKAKGTPGFEPEIASRIAWTEISILPKAEEPERPEGRVVAEITVEEGEPCFFSLRISGLVVRSVKLIHSIPCLSSLSRFLDMLNGSGTIHGACSALLIDKCVSHTVSNLPEPSFGC